MKKRLYSFLMFAIILTFGCMAAFATKNEALVLDYQGIFSDSEATEINQKLIEISDKYEMSFVFMTMADVHDEYTAKNAAADAYDYGGYETDGVILLISKNGGQGENYIYAVCSGTAMNKFTNFNGLKEDLADYVISGDIVGAANKYIDIMNDTFGFNTGKFIFRSLVIVAVAMLIAIIICGSMASGLKSVHKKTEAGTYVIPGSMQLTNRWDNFVTKKTTKVKIETNSGGGGSSFTGSSGTSHTGGGGAV